MKRGLVARGGLLIPAFVGVSLIASFLAVLSPAIPDGTKLPIVVVSAVFALVLTGVTVIPRKKSPAKKPPFPGGRALPKIDTKTFLRENADIIAVIAAIALVGVYFSVVKPLLVAGTINSGQVSVKIDEGDTGTTEQAGHAIVVYNVPTSNTGDTRTCYFDNDTAYSGAASCTVNGSNSCAVSSFTLLNCSGTNTVWVRCRDANDASYGTTQNYDSIVCDTSAPTAGTISSPATGTWDTDGSYNVVWATGSDAQSGIKNDTLFRAFATLSGGSCGSYGSYSANSTTPGTTSQATMATGCYSYFVRTCNGAS